MPKPPAVAPTPSSKQRQVLKVLKPGRFIAVIEHHASDNTWLSFAEGASDEKLLPGTFWALHRQGWIEEIATWASLGVTYWTISAAGLEALE
jgi:hypothetical protein